MADVCDTSFFKKIGRLWQLHGADILSKWRTYTDEVVGIFAETDGILHNTINPIARATSSGFDCDLVLRNNITTKERPLGVFHPNPTLHHIKKKTSD